MHVNYKVINCRFFTSCLCGFIDKFLIKIQFNHVATSNSEIFCLVLCQSKRDDDHRRVVGDPANQEAAHDEERHLRGKVKYRVIILHVQNLQLTSKPQFRFGLGRPGQARPKWNFGFEVNRRF